MQHPGFFDRAGPFPLSEVAKTTGSELRAGADPARLVHDVRTLLEAGPDDLSFVDNRRYLTQLPQCRAAACLIAPAFVPRLPAGIEPLTSRAVYRGFALALAMFYPGAMRPRAARAGGTVAIDPTARLETGVEIEPGAIIGPEVMIGRGTRVAAGAVVGYRCAIGRDAYIGPGASVTHALVGNRVIIHAGARIGQDGFGFAMGPRGHLKVPQIGRVIIQDDVEIGANTCIDRGALKDTVIGEGSKIDNLVQIGHNSAIGRNCVIVGQVGIAGSATLEDFVVIGGQGGVVGHVRIGQGAQIAGGSHATNDVPAGARMVGTPAIPIRDWMRAQRAVERLARSGPGADDGDGAGRGAGQRAGEGAGQGEGAGHDE